jgi:serine/threonine protein kinase
VEKEILTFRWSNFKDHKSLDGVSSDAKDFLQHLLEHSPSKRFSAEQAQKHTWLNSNIQQSDIQPSSSIRVAVYDYANASELKKLALQGA